MRLRTKLLGGILATLLLQIAMTGTFTLTYFLVKTRSSLQTDLSGDWDHARAYVEELKHSLTTQVYQLAFFLRQDQAAGASSETLRGMLRYFISLTNADRIVLIDDSGVILADEKAGITGTKDDLPIAYLRPRDFLFPRTQFISVKDPGPTTHLYLVTGCPVPAREGGGRHLYLVTNIDAGVVDAIREKTGTEVAFFAGRIPVLSSETWEPLRTDEPLKSRTIRLGDTSYRVYSRAISADLPDKVYLVAIRSLLAEGLYVRSVILSYVTAFLVTLAASVFVAAGVTGLVISPFSRLSQWLHRYMDTGTVSGLDVRSRDEVGFLAETFHGMVSTLIREKQVISDQLDEISVLHGYNERIMNSIPAGIVVADPGGTIEFSNGTFADLVECPAGALTGQGLPAVMERRFTLRGGGPAGAAFDLRGEAVPSGTEMVVEGLKAEVPDGRPRQFTAKISGISLSGGRRGALVVLEDVTASEEAWEKMIVADKVASLGILSAGVAHEINNPLGSILSHVDYLKAVEKEESKLESLSWIENETNRIAALVRRIRAYSAPGGDQPGGASDLNRAVRDTVEVLRFTLEKRRLSLALDLDDRLPAVSCPADELKQVVLNLLLNAQEACAEGGAIRVRTARGPSGAALLGITDDGEGIEPGALRNIFDPFFTTKKSRQGNGLGLSICWTILKRAGGDIRVSSLPGRGTEIEVMLRCT
jgi:signal transduction histidine kinase